MSAETQESKLGREALQLPVLPAHPAEDRFGRDRAALRLPAFLRRPIGRGEQVAALRRRLGARKLHTVCEEARCPNLDECFRNRTATFMLMGADCTRACGFCAVGTGTPRPLDPAEPESVAEAAAEMELEHVVLTSVNRDDLPDGGAAHLRAALEAIHRRCPDASLEILTPDFCGDLDAVRLVAEGPLDVYNHNLETVERLQRRVRPRASYERSLEVLAAAKATRSELVTKSGIMVGLGERPEEVRTLMEDLRAVGVTIMTIGQYLRPGLRQLPVVEYLKPEAYEIYRAWGLELGFDHVFAGPFVRSSYHAGEALREAQRPKTGR